MILHFGKPSYGICPICERKIYLLLPDYHKGTDIYSTIETSLRKHSGWKEVNIDGTIKLACDKCVFLLAKGKENKEEKS